MLGFPFYDISFSPAPQCGVARVRDGVGRVRWDEVVAWHKASLFMNDVGFRSGLQSSHLASQEPWYFVLCTDGVKGLTHGEIFPHQNTWLVWTVLGAAG